MTRPTDAMRKAMADAEVGDDVFSEDPTVNRLQERVAELLNKEAALFVPSGTMANQVCIAALTRPGDEILLDEDAHILNHEAGAPSLLSGVQLRTAKGNRGRLNAQLVRERIKIGSDHVAATTLVSVENTHNRGGGTIYDLQELRGIQTVTTSAKIKLHMDGARLWNAAAGSGISEAKFADCVDVVSVCFSKGLGAPLGSAVAGSKDFIKGAHRFRKIFGGGMRQAGIVAAAALYALNYHRDSLRDDHAKAKTLATTLLQSPKLTMDGPVETNILYFNLVNSRLNAAQLVKACEADGVLFFDDGGPFSFRLVTHRDVSAEATAVAADVILKHLH